LAETVTREVGGGTGSVTHIAFGHWCDSPRTDTTFTPVIVRRSTNLPSLAYSLESAKGGEMKIACCTLEMITLIFLLFVSLNGGFSYLNAPETDLESRSTTELVSAWGEPDRIVAAADIGFASSQLEAVEIWSYENPLRSVIVRHDMVVSIQPG
jgi:hypothetical protein